MGLEIARDLGGRGCRIVLSYRHSRKPAQEAVQQLAGEGVEAWDLRCDTSNENSVLKAVRDIAKHAGGLGILVNLASIYERTPDGLDPGAQSWDAHMEANARSAYLLTLAAAPLMKKQGGGRIIHISDWTSASGRPRYRDYGPYYASKVAVKAVVESTALTFAPEVLVNAIAPGPILPPPDMSPRERKAVEKATPLGHWGGPAEIARAVVFLAETDFVTGETLRVDGGRHLY